MSLLSTSTLLWTMHRNSFTVVGGGGESCLHGHRLSHSFYTPVMQVLSLSADENTFALRVGKVM